MVDGLNFDGYKPERDSYHRKGESVQKEKGETFEMFGKKYQYKAPPTNSSGQTLAISLYEELPSSTMDSIFAERVKPKETPEEKPLELPPEWKLPKEKEPEKDLPKLPDVKLPETPEDEKPIDVPKDIKFPYKKEPVKEFPKLPQGELPETPKEVKPEAEEKPKDESKMSIDNKSVVDGAFSKEYAQELIKTYGHTADYTETTNSKGKPVYVNKNTGETIGASLYKQLITAEGMIE